MYSKDSALPEATEDLELTRQNANGPENTYTSRIGNADYRFGHVYSDNKKIRIFEKKYLPSVRPILERFRREKPHYRLTFNLTSALARDEG